MKQYVVIGMGRFGQEIAAKLYELGNEVLALDQNELNVKNMSNCVTYAVVGDAQNIEVLRKLGVKNYDTAVVAIGGDLTASILITMNLKELGGKNVICKAQNERHKLALEKVGADRVMIPEKLIAGKLAESLSSAKVLDYINLSGDFSIVETVIPEKWVGHSIAQLNVSSRYHVVLLAIKRGQRMMVSPDTSAPFEAGDVVLALGENSALDKIKQL